MLIFFFFFPFPGLPDSGGLNPAEFLQGLVQLTAGQPGRGHGQELFQRYRTGGSGQGVAQGGGKPPLQDGMGAGIVQQLAQCDVALFEIQSSSPPKWDAPVYAPAGDNLTAEERAGIIGDTPLTF